MSNAGVWNSTGGHILLLPRLESSCFYASMTTHINNNTSLPANNNGVTEDKGKDKVKVTVKKKLLRYRVVKKNIC